MCKFLDNLDLGECSKQLRICHNKCKKLAEMSKWKFQWWITAHLEIKKETHTYNVNIKQLMDVKTKARNILEVIMIWKLNVIFYKLYDPGKVKI